MIKVKYVMKDSILEEVSIDGHADYDTLGKDIVCAAVSSVVTTTINDIIALSKKSIDYNAKEGKVYIAVKDRDEITQKLLNVMLNTLEELSKEYPQNIKIGGLK